MNRFFVVILVLASLVAHAKCAGFKLAWLSKPDKAEVVDYFVETAWTTVPAFNGLDMYLIKTLPLKEDTQSNLNHIKAKVHKLFGDIKIAAELLLKVPDIQNGCDDQYLDIIKEITRNTKIDVFFGQKRIEKLLRNAGLDRAAILCKDYLSSIEKSISKDERYAKLFHALGPVAHLENNKIHDDDHYKVIDVVRRMIEQYGEAQSDELTALQQPEVDDTEFLHAFNTYLLEPCRRLYKDQHVRQFIEHAFIFEKFTRRHQGDDMTFYLDIYRLDSRRDSCIFVLNMDARSRRNELL